MSKISLKRVMYRGEVGELFCCDEQGKRDLDVLYLHNIFPSLFGGVDPKKRWYEIKLEINEETQGL